MTTFCLIRHGTYEGMQRFLAGRKLGINLNNGGRREAELLGRALKDSPIEAIYSSPLERALETAEAVARPLNLDVRVRDGLNEIDYGDWAGTTFAVLSNQSEWQRFNTFRSRTRIPGGESMQEAQTRILNELESLSGVHPDGVIAVVSHSDMIKAVLTHFAGMNLDLLQRFEVWPCSFSIVTENRGEMRLITTNNISEPWKAIQS